METKANILNELEQISQAVATIGNRNVYSVPDGYFNNLPAEMLVKVQMLNVQANPMPYSVPDGYFDGLAGSIMDKIRLKKTIQPVVESNEDLEEDTLPRFIPHPYTVPVGYFDSLAGNVMAKINAQQIQHAGNEVFEELEALAPLLNSITKQMPYSVPAGYFEQFTVKVNEEVKPAAKVVSINSSRRRFITYFAAACVAVLLGIGAYFFVPHQSAKPGPTGQQSQLDVQRELASLSDADINEYLNNQPSTGSEALPSSLEEQAPEIQPVIDNTSTEEIQQYLKENSGPDEKRGKDI